MKPFSATPARSRAGLRHRPQPILNAIEVTLLIVFLAAWVGSCTVPSSAEIARNNRSINHLDCREGTGIDLRTTIAANLDRCELGDPDLAANASWVRRMLPSPAALLVIAGCALALFLVLFVINTRLGGPRGALLRPRLRLVLLLLLAARVGLFVVVERRAEASVASQKALNKSVRDACERVTKVYHELDEKLTAACARLGFTRAGCEAAQPKLIELRNARRSDLLDEIVNDVQQNAGAGTRLTCAERKPDVLDTLADPFETFGGGDVSSPAVPPVDAGVHDADLEGGGDRRGGGAGGDSRDTEKPDPGVVPPGGCNTDNCLSPATCVGDRCYPPKRTDPKKKKDIELEITIQALIALGIPGVIATLIVDANEKETSSVAQGQAVYDIVRAYQQGLLDQKQADDLADAARRQGVQGAEDARAGLANTPAGRVLAGQLDCIAALRNGGTQQRKDWCTGNLAVLHDRLRDLPSCHPLDLAGDGKAVIVWLHQCQCPVWFATHRAPPIPDPPASTFACTPTHP